MRRKSKAAFRNCVLQRRFRAFLDAAEMSLFAKWKKIYDTRQVRFILSIEDSKEQSANQRLELSLTPPRLGCSLIKRARNLTRAVQLNLFSQRLSGGLESPLADVNHLSGPAVLKRCGEAVKTENVGLKGTILCSKPARKR